MTEAPPPRNIDRVAIIGTGAVGATTAYALIQATRVSQVVLVDKNRRLAEGEVMDLQHCLPFTGHQQLEVADAEDVRDCDMVIVTAGAAQKPGESRLELVKRNTDIFSNLFPLLSDNNPGAFFLIVTNPVDVMTRVALKLSGLPPRQVFGSGTVLDTARFRSLLSQHFHISPHHCHAYVIGEHGDSEVLMWSRATIGPFTVGEYSDHHSLVLTPDDKERINRTVRQAAYEIIERKGSTHFAIGLATARIFNALTYQQDAVLTVSRRFEGLYRRHGVCLSVPTLVNRTGAHSHFELEMSFDERQEFLHSAEVVDGVYTDLGLGD
jgi:L-lactate dehydrogenase